MVRLFKFSEKTVRFVGSQSKRERQEHHYTAYWLGNPITEKKDEFWSLLQRILLHFLIV